jgi:Alpha/beta hydrolase domain
MTGPTLRPVPHGRGVPQATATVAGYAEEEHLVTGVADTYSGPASGPATVASRSNPYVTRILVRYPNDPARFSGRVLLEPFNTSSGADVDAIWSRAAPVLVDQGDAWVGVSQRVSSEKELKQHDSRRYGAVSIPSNDVAWDVLRQVGGLVRDPGAGPLRGRRAERLYLAGYSQSGAEAAAFAMAFHDRSTRSDGSPLFDGYFPAAHSGSVTSLQSGRARLPTFESMPMQAVAVPVVDVETQTDVEGFHVHLSDDRRYTSPGGAHIRRDDSDRPEDRYRLYEVAAAPHASNVQGCDGELSTFPTDAFLRAALVHLFRWAEDGVGPPSAPRLELSALDVVSRVQVDDVGNAVGGVRSPFVDVPLARYDAHSSPGPRCVLAGRETTMAPTELTARYGDAGAYLEAFAANLDATINAGFLLEQDRAGLLGAQQAKAEQAFHPNS